jgi:hypothetical protein
MTTTTILIVSAIASAFLLFAGVLAWGDFYSRETRQEPSVPEHPATADSTASFDRRKAA